VWIQIHIFGFWFGSTIFFRIRIQIRILILIFWHEVFLNSASHCFPMCSGICTTEKKVFQWGKRTVFFSFKSFLRRFVTQIFVFQKCLDPNPNSNPNIFFGFGSSQNIRILSDLYPQHWSVKYSEAMNYFARWFSFCPKKAGSRGDYR
jgi:hypothetical protein